MQVVVLHNQSLFDVAIQYCGTVEAVFDLALENGLSLTQELSPGQLITIPKKDYGFQSVVSVFKNDSIQPASALSEVEIEMIDARGGIGSMVIGSTFIVE